MEVTKSMLSGRVATRTCEPLGAMIRFRQGKRDLPRYFDNGVITPYRVLVFRMISLALAWKL